MTALLCLLFFSGYIAIRVQWQAIVFLMLGAGIQWLSQGATVPTTDAPTQDSTQLILVCMFSVFGYVAWHSTRKWLDTPYRKERLFSFLGWGVNGLIATFLLWQTGMITLPV